jgi:hypothetical protein
MIRTIKVISMTVICTSCAVPSHYQAGDISSKMDLTCISPKREMMVTMSYNICPLLANKPTEKADYWKISDFNERFNKAALTTHQHVNLIKDCSGKGNTLHMYLLSPKDQLSVRHYTSRSDTVKANRLFAYGSWVKADETLSWQTEFAGDKLDDIALRVLVDFTACRP